MFQKYLTADGGYILFIHIVLKITGHYTTLIFKITKTSCLSLAPYEVLVYRPPPSTLQTIQMGKLFVWRKTNTTTIILAHGFDNKYMVTWFQRQLSKWVVTRNRIQGWKKLHHARHQMDKKIPCCAAGEQGGKLIRYSDSDRAYLTDSDTY